MAETTRPPDPPPPAARIPWYRRVNGGWVTAGILFIVLISVIAANSGGGGEAAPPTPDPAPVAPAPDPAPVAPPPPVPVVSPDEEPLLDAPPLDPDAAALVKGHEEPDPPEEPEPEAPPVAPVGQDETNLRERTEACLSPWDGNHNGFEDQIRPLLNNEGSMQTHETRFGTVFIGPNEVAIRMEYSAENALGGRVKTVAAGRLNVETCAVTVVFTGLE